jgi:hypothetical protein
MQMQRVSDEDYLKLDYDAWKHHVYDTGDQRFNTICTMCNTIQSVGKPIKTNTIWWVCHTCIRSEEE